MQEAEYNNFHILALHHKNSDTIDILSACTRVTRLVTRTDHIAD
jgi:hypothetical protein